ncbi:MAG: hypothetical protein DI532_12230 [Azospirillum brasilense]|nr:MAG: hypothetical protein DI532_12230 [Azospirillum brasilense]
MMFRSRMSKVIATLGLGAAMFAPFLATGASAEGYYSERLYRTQVESPNGLRPHTHEDHYRARQEAPVYPGVQGYGATMLERSGATGGGGQGS